MVKLTRDQRKSRLAEATWQVILEQGVGAVSVRTVAAEAGVAVGSLRHLFPTQAGLLEFSAELMLKRATARISALPPASDDLELAMNAIREVLPLTEQTRREFEINIALIAATPSNPDLALIRDRAHRELCGLFVRIVTMLRQEAEPTTQGQREARRLLALVDGLGLHLLHENDDDVIDIVRDELNSIRQGSSLTP